MQRTISMPLSGVGVKGEKFSKQAGEQDKYQIQPKGMTGEAINTISGMMGQRGGFLYWIAKRIPI